MRAERMGGALLLLVLLADMAGCASAPLPPPASADDLGRLVLQQTLTVPEGKARVLMQYGKVVSRVDESDPACVLEHWQVSGAVPLTVLPDTFRIADVSHRRGEVGSGFGVDGSTDMGMGVYFGLGGFGYSQPMGVGRHGDGPRMAQGAVLMRLVSERQPLVYKLSCFGAVGFAPFVQPPSVDDMRAALGDVADLRLSRIE